MADRDLLRAAALFAVATTFGGAVSLREDVRGEPLGIRPDGSVAAQLAWGWGGGVSAPWPMPAATLVAACCARGDRRWPGTIARAVGWCVVGGTLIEPVTWGRRARSRWVSSAIAVNLAAAVALIRTPTRW